ncbi:MAG TPA: hypothetical protein VIL86_01855 [Tepidisphaeraceae bacterium]
MAEKHRKLTKEEAPDTARVYERADPAKESGMGRLDNNKAVPAQGADQMHQAVKNKQALRQINAEDETDQQQAGQDARARRDAAAAPQPDHSMREEEPMGEDQAPMDIKDKRQKRQPRTEGKGGTP